MKKLLSILLLVLICFSLVACGGNEPQTNNNGSQQDSVDATDTNKKISLNEPFMVGDYEFTITDYQFLDGVPAVEWVQLQNLMSEGDCYLQVNFEIAYKGKNSVWGHTQEWYSLNYGDDYVLTDGHGLYKDESRSFGWTPVSVSTEFIPLSESKICRWYFSLPNEVRESEEKPLSFVISIDDKVETYIIR